METYPIRYGPASLRYVKSSQLLLVGTYQLTDQLNDRTGDLIIFDASNGDRLDKRYTIPLDAGIFRLTTETLIDNATHVFCALTNGSIAAVNIDNMQLKKYSRVSDAMLLSVCVNQSIDPSIAVVSDSTGNIITIDLINDQIINKWIAHRLSYQSINTTCETWSTAFCDNNSSLILSGGDDGQFKYWDIRQTLQTPVMINKSHKSGVVFISTISSVITGSYDEYIRVWDIRRFDQPVNERQLDGGVWNVQFDNSNNKQHLLVACMYGGWMRLMADDLTVINSNQQLGEQLLYDVCICDNSQSIVTCTFNNRTVYLIKNN